MRSPLVRVTTFTVIGAAHLGLIILSTSKVAAAITPPVPLPIQMVSVSTPKAPTPPAPAPAKPAPAKPQKAVPKQMPTPAPVITKPSPRAIQSEPVPVATAPSPAPAEPTPVAAAPAPVAAPNPAPAPVVPPTHIGGHLGNPKPVYPALSIELGEAGSVGLRVSVGADGKAQDVALARSSGFPRLDRAALQAVRHWRFRPAMRGGEAIPFVYTFSVEFDLSKA